MYVLQRVLPVRNGPAIYIVFAVSRDTDKLKAWVESTYLVKPDWVKHNYGFESEEDSDGQYWLIHLINDLDNNR